MIKTKVFQINPVTFEDTSISIEDASLITTQQLDEQFDTNNNRVELYLYLPPTLLVGSYYNYSGWKSYQDPSLPSTGKLQDLYINPEIDSALAEVSNGDVYAIYNFVILIFQNEYYQVLSYTSEYLILYFLILLLSEESCNQRIP